MSEPTIHEDHIDGMAGECARCGEPLPEAVEVLITDPTGRIGALTAYSGVGVGQRHVVALGERIDAYCRGCAMHAPGYGYGLAVSLH